VLHVSSGQVRINPCAEVILTSSHDEIRGGPLGLSPKGCGFPADDRWRIAVQDASLRVGKRLAAAGLVSRLPVEWGGAFPAHKRSLSGKTRAVSAPDVGRRFDNTLVGPHLIGSKSSWRKACRWFTKDELTDGELR
jgi:hypothetical protein